MKIVGLINHTHTLTIAHTVAPSRAHISHFRILSATTTPICFLLTFFVLIALIFCVLHNSRRANELWILHYVHVVTNEFPVSLNTHRIKTNHYAWKEVKEGNGIAIQNTWAVDTTIK
jgi:uncharacterized membrane protein YhaH (DUF805 family)